MAIETEINNYLRVNEKLFDALLAKWTFRKRYAVAALRRVVAAHCFRASPPLSQANCCQRIKAMNQIHRTPPCSRPGSRRLRQAFCAVFDLSVIAGRLPTTHRPSAGCRAHAEHTGAAPREPARAGKRRRPQASTFIHRRAGRLGLATAPGGARALVSAGALAALVVGLFFFVNMVKTMPCHRDRRRQVDATC